MSLIEVDHDLCQRDGLCVSACPAHIVEMPDDGFPRAISGAEEICLDCGHCVAVCPHKALTQRAMAPADCPELPRGYRPDRAETERFIRSRRSIRRFKDEQVPRTELEDLIALAAHAPSGHNMQPVRWLIFSGREQLRPLAGLVIDWMKYLVQEQPKIAALLHLDRPIAAWEEGRDRVLRDAPQLVLTYGLKDDRTAGPACTLALGTMELCAPAFGLGCCWAGYFGAAAQTYPPLMEALGLPKVQRVYGAMMVGKPKLRYHRLPKRNAARITWR